MKERITIFFVPTSFFLILFFIIFAVAARVSIEVRTVICYATAILFWGGLCLLIIGMITGGSSSSLTILGGSSAVLSLSIAVFALIVMNMIFGCMNFISLAGARIEYISVKELFLPWAYKSDKQEAFWDEIREYMESENFDDLVEADISKSIAKMGIKIGEGKTYYCEDEEDGVQMIIYHLQSTADSAYGIYLGEYDGQREGNGTWFYEDSDGRDGMYIGEWKNNYPNGRGVNRRIDDKSGTYSYKGNFIDGRSDGEVKMEWEYKSDNFLHMTIEYKNGIALKLDLADQDTLYRDYYSVETNQFIIAISEEIAGDGMPVGVMLSYEGGVTGVGYAMK